MEWMRPEEAAVTVAREFGLAVATGVTLADSNNVVVWLEPSRVVAKVGTGHHHSLRLELDVARHLVARRAPVVAPATELPREVHHLGGFDMTFWRHQEHEGREQLDSQKFGRALFDLHQTLATYPGPLPSYDGELDKVSDVLNEPGRCPALDEADRLLLLSALRRFRAELASWPDDKRVLHGSPHDLNVLVVRGEPRFIDFETTCRGPVEWDLAHIGSEAVAAYQDAFDPRVLASCSALVSVKTAAWCWARIDHPGLRWHAVHHLAVVKTLMRQPG
jgi:Ser/Thr protein kinase RdoA (MazF antagonist)